METIPGSAFLLGIHLAPLNTAGERGCLAPHGSGTCPAGLCSADAPLLFCLTHNSWGGRPQRRRLLPEKKKKTSQDQMQHITELHRPCETDWSTNKPETTHASSNSCLTRNRTCEPLEHTGGSGALLPLLLTANTHWQWRQPSEEITCSFTSVHHTGRGQWRTGPETHLLVSPPLPLPPNIVQTLHRSLSSSIATTVLRTQDVSRDVHGNIMVCIQAAVRSVRSTLCSKYFTYY